MKLKALAILLLTAILNTHAIPHPGIEFDAGFSIEGDINFDRLLENHQKSNIDGSINPILGEQNILRDIFDGFRRSTEIGINEGAHFAESIGKAIDGFFTEADHFADKVAVSAQTLVNDSLNNFITVVGTLQTTIATIVKDIEDNSQRYILLKVQNALGKAVSSAENLQEFKRNVSDQLRTDVEESTGDILNSWNNWANSTLAEIFKALNGNHSQNVQNLIDDYIDTYAGYLNVCSEEIIDDIQKYESDIQNAVEIDRDVVQSLIREVQLCSQLSNQQCKQSISSDLRKLLNSPREFSALVKEGNKFLNNYFYNHICIHSTLSHFQQEQPEILGKIVQIIISEYPCPA